MKEWLSKGLIAAYSVRVKDKTIQVHSKSCVNKLGYINPREKHVTLQKGMKGSYIN